MPKIFFYTHIISNTYFYRQDKFLKYTVDCDIIIYNIYIIVCIKFKNSQRVKILKIKKMLLMLITILMTALILLSCSKRPSEQTSETPQPQETESQIVEYFDAGEQSEDCFYSLCRKNADGSVEKIIDRYYSPNFWIHGDKIYYIGDGKDLYRINSDKTDKTKIDFDGYGFRFDHDSMIFDDAEHMYFSCKNFIGEKGIYRIDYNFKTDEYKIWSEEDIADITEDDILLKKVSDGLNTDGYYLFASTDDGEIPIADLNEDCIYMVYDNKIFYVNSDGDLNSANFGGFCNRRFTLGGETLDFYDILDAEGTTIVSLDYIKNGWLIFTAQNKNGDIRECAASVEDICECTVVNDDFTENFLK